MQYRPEADPRQHFGLPQTGGTVVDQDVRGMDWGPAMHGIKFVRCDFRGTALRGRRLHEVTFIECALDGLDLTGSTLSESQFVNCTGAELLASRTRWHDGSLTGCHWPQADFRDAHLERHVCRQSDLGQSLWGRARLSYCDWTAVQLPGWQAEDIDVSESALIAHRLTDVELARATFRRCVLADASMDGACLDGIRLEECSLVGVQLRGATLRGADLRGSLFLEAELTDADLAEAKAPGAGFDHATMTGASLVRADLTSTMFVCAVLQRAEFDHACLVRACFQGADLRGASLTGADARRAVFRRADMRGARVENTNLREADLHAAQGVEHLSRLRGCRSTDLVLCASEDYDPSRVADVSTKKETRSCLF